MNQLQTVINRIKIAAFLLFISFSVQSQSNYAVNFDGTDDYISLPTSVAVSQSNTFTIEAWVYWNGTNNGCIYSETVLGNNNPMFSIIPRSSDGGGIELTFRDNSATGLTLQPATAKVTANTWVHVAVVRTSATNMKIYIDGVLKDDASFTAPASWTPTKVNTGVRWRASQSDFFAGKIDELRIWNTARTETQIKANMFNRNLANNATGLVAYYRMNEGSGTTATNSCTNTPAIDGTLTNGPTWAASPIQFAGNALHFDHADDRVIAALATTATSNVTMELWVNHEGGTSTEHLLVSNGVMGTNGYAMYINTQRKLCIQYNAVGVWNTNYVLTSNTWTHLALVIGTTGFTVYANGVNVYSNTATPITPTGSFILGFNTIVGGHAFDGKMDEVRVWNVARTQTEIQNTMNNEINPLTSGLTLYYTFNQGSAGGSNSGLTTVIDQTGNNNGTLTNFSLSGATSNFLTQNSGMSILPLKWISFTALKRNDGVLLQWSTASEVNTSEFMIEHQSESSAWKSIATLISKSNSSEKNEYSYLDRSPANGINNYRIKQRDADGKYSHSEIRIVRMSDQLQSLEVLSNPVVNKTLQVQINSAKQQVSLIGVGGTVLWQKELPRGTHAIDLNNIKKGIYILNSNDNTTKLVVK
ncbi:MAG: LamG domain-containing protein [Flavisolibacter sp.]|nr:LamG domain-containing protein [Flavisolibacter sp.]